LILFGFPEKFFSISLILSTIVRSILTCAALELRLGILSIAARGGAVALRTALLIFFGSFCNSFIRLKFLRFVIGYFIDFIGFSGCKIRYLIAFVKFSKKFWNSGELTSGMVSGVRRWRDRAALSLALRRSRAMLSASRASGYARTTL
jgi:hypothetical protein